VQFEITQHVDSLRTELVDLVQADDVDKGHGYSNLSA
jgi:hypothetical protein